MNNMMTYETPPIPPIYCDRTFHEVLATNHGVLATNYETLLPFYRVPICYHYRALSACHRVLAAYHGALATFYRILPAYDEALAAYYKRQGYYELFVLKQVYDGIKQAYNEIVQTHYGVVLICGNGIAVTELLVYNDKVKQIFCNIFITQNKISEEFSSFIRDTREEIITIENHPELFIMKNGQLANGCIKDTMMIRNNDGMENLIKKAMKIGYIIRIEEEINIKPINF